MNGISRRGFLAAAGVATGAVMTGCAKGRGTVAATAMESRDPYVTCFYQFDRETLRWLGGPNGLPNGPQYQHIFSMSHAGHAAHPETANMVRAGGPSFKYARAIDIWKYKDWKEASDEQLRQWAIEFRKEALPKDGPSDYFAFNEMPTGAEGRPELQHRIAHWMRSLHDPDDGGPKLKGVFYLVEENVVPSAWKGDAIDELWSAVDETSVLVVGEHYHNTQYMNQLGPEKFTEHLFDMARWLDESGKEPQRNIARHKYAVLHSSYYGAEKTPWEGLQTGTSTPAQFKAYLQQCVEATRRSPYGRRRISFGPLRTKQLDDKDLLPAITDVLHRDAMAFKAR